MLSKFYTLLHANNQTIRLSTRQYRIKKKSIQTKGNRVYHIGTDQNAKIEGFEMKWNKIETVPKHISVLLYENKDGHEITTVGKWDLDEYAKKPKPYWRTEKGYLYGKTFDRNFHPSHWCFLHPPKEFMK